MFYSKRSPKYLPTLLIYSHTSRMIIVCLLVIGDILGLLLCFDLALRLRVSQPLDLGMPILYALIAMYLFGLYLTDTYKLNREVSGVRSKARQAAGRGQATSQTAGFSAGANAAGR